MYQQMTEPLKGFRYSRLVRPDPITSTVRCIANSSTGQSSWSRRLHPKTISPLLLLVLGRCGWPGLNAPSPFPPPCIRMVSIGLPAAPGKALGRPSCATFPDAPKIQRPPEALAAGPILTRGGCGSWRCGSQSTYQARDMSTRCIRSSRSRPPCGVCPLERAGEQRATCCSPQQSSCRLGSRLTRRLETSPLISSLARGSLGGQASWPRGPDTVLSIQFLVCLWWFLAHTRAAGPCHCRLALSSLCSVLHSPRFRPVFVRFVPWRKGGLPLLPLAVPSDFLPSAPHA